MHTGKKQNEPMMVGEKNPKKPVVQRDERATRLEGTASAELGERLPQEAENDRTPTLFEHTNQGLRALQETPVLNTARQSEVIPHKTKPHPLPQMQLPTPAGKQSRYTTPLSYGTRTKPSSHL